MIMKKSKSLVSLILAITILAGMINFSMMVKANDPTLIPNNTNEGIVNISEGKETYSPDTINGTDSVDKLVDGTIGKWCPNDFRTGDTPTNVFAVIKLGDAAVKADGFRLYMSSITGDPKYTSIREFNIYATNDDAVMSAAKGTDFSDTSKYTKVFDSLNSDIPIFHGTNSTQDYINTPVWPLPQGVSYDAEGESHHQIIIDKYNAGEDFATMQAFQTAFDAKYLVFEVTGNMDANPRVPELMVFKGTAAVEDKVELKDSTSNISVTANRNDLPQGAGLSVEKLTSGDAFNNAKTALNLTSTTELFSMWDINIKNSDQVKVLFDKNATVKIPVPTGEDAAKLSVYKIVGGTATKITVTAANGFFTFDTTGLGIFALVKQVTLVDNSSSDASSDTNNSSSSNVGSPDTGSNNDMLPVIILVLSSVAVIGILKKKYLVQ
jgi:hypothetical protein